MAQMEDLIRGSLACITLRSQNLLVTGVYVHSARGQSPGAVPAVQRAVGWVEHEEVVRHQRRIASRQRLHVVRYAPPGRIATEIQKVSVEQPTQLQSKSVIAFYCHDPDRQNFVFSIS